VNCIEQSANPSSVTSSCFSRAVHQVLAPGLDNEMSLRLKNLRVSQPFKPLMACNRSGKAIIAFASKSSPYTAILYIIETPLDAA
jgi:hypothetical protein